jgi:hypothetical protein
MRLSATTLFITLSCLAVGAVTVAGIATIGGPGKAREQSLDGQRLDAIRQLAGATDGYYVVHGALPASLGMLAAGQDGIAPSVLRDPQSGEAYGYRTTGPTSFELCASFARPSGEDEAIRWRHPAGPHCFTDQVRQKSP